MNAPVRPAHGRNIAARHKSVARMMGFCLAADDASTWCKLADVLAIRLSPSERAAIAVMAMVSLDGRDRDAAIAAAFHAASDGRAAA